MLKRPSGQRLTLEERVAVVVAILVAIGVHVAIFLGGSGISRLVQEEKPRERLMVIRRVPITAPLPDQRVRVPSSRRLQVPSEPGPAGTVDEAPPKAELKISPRGTVPTPKPESATEMEEDVLASAPEEEMKVPQPKPEEAGDSSLSVVTDLVSASFTLSGPDEYRGTGTYWIRRGVPPGTYRIAFNAVDGFGTPPPQTKVLPAKGQLVFVGKYQHRTEVVVESNEPAAQFSIYRPDGRPLDMVRPGRAFFDDLPLGNYTVVFKDVPGRVAPRPLSRALVAGGSLRFFGEYRDLPGTRNVASQEREAEPPALPKDSRKAPAGTAPPAPRGAGTASPAPRGAELDRRVQLVVKSYPLTDIEEDHDPIDYPEMIIRKSNFQQGWCQVYLVLKITAEGEVGNVMVERPRQAERAQYEALISAVEKSVRAWDYDRVASEVHVDVRFYVE